MRRLMWSGITTFLVLMVICAFASGSGADTCSSNQRIYNFTNNCSFPIWVGAANDAAGTITLKPSWKWSLPAGESRTACAIDNVWSGRFWARTGCAFDSKTVFYPSCLANSDCPTNQSIQSVCYNGVCVKQGCQTNAECMTFTGSPASICYPDLSSGNKYCIISPACSIGDCNGTLECAGPGTPPVVLTEFTLGQAGVTADNYDLSAADGMYSSVEIVPIPNTYSDSCNYSGCTEKGPSCPNPCSWDLAATCPPELRVYSGSTVVGCSGPNQFCSNVPGCYSGGAACAQNSDCCSGVCTANQCAAGSSLDCGKVYSIGTISCTAAADCPPVSSIPCSSNSSCPDGTTCSWVQGAAQSLCVMNCVSGACKSVACSATVPCGGATWPILNGQNLGCDLNPASPTYNTCQPTSASLYACTGINTTSCHNTAPYGTKATWCCGGATWQTNGPGTGSNPTWKAVAEPFAAILHNACPTAYSFPYDDNPNVLNTCIGNAGGSYGYNITFCPSQSGGLLTLTVNLAGKGGGVVTSTPSGINCGTACKHSFANGSTVTLKAVPKTGYVLDTWTGCTTASGATCTVNMSSAKAVTAIFNKPPVIGVAPAALAFGPVKMGVVSAAKTITVKNNGVAQLVVTSVSLEGSTDFLPSNKCANTPLDTGETCLITVSVRPTSYGAKAGTLKIGSNSLKNPLVSVALSANAAPPVMAVAPKAINFGAVKAGQKATGKITIKNTGVSNLTVGPVSTPGDASFTVNSQACGTVTQNGTCQITVQFTAPSPAQGIRRSTFTIGSNASPTPVTVNLAGRGK